MRLDYLKTLINHHSYFFKNNKIQSIIYLTLFASNIELNQMF